MSGFRAIFQRRGRGESPSPAASTAEASTAAQPADGSLCLGPFRVEVSSAGPASATAPLLHRRGARVLAFDGRLDNRRELLRALGEVPAGAPFDDGADDRADDGVKDGEIVLAAYERWGEAFVERLLGPFALVLFDAFSRRLLCARDGLGQRTLYFHAGDERFAVASDEVTLLALPGVGDRLDEGTVARHFAVQGPLPGHTFWAEIRELRPGHRLVVTPESCRLERFWAPPERQVEERRSDASWCEEFAALFEQAVACRLRGLPQGTSPAVPGVLPPMVLLSGGLDSAAVAGVAGRLAKEAGSDPLPAVSWIFETHPECDESGYMADVARHGGLPWHPVPADDAWPDPTTVADPCRAYSDPFGPAVARAYERAAEIGTSVLLTGYWGDQLFSSYPGTGSWVRSLLRQGRIAGTALGVGERLVRRPPTFDGLRRRLRAATRRDGSPAGTCWSPHLTEHALSLLSEDPSEELSDEASGELSGPLEPLHVWMATGRRRVAARRGLDLRDPFRDRRLVELVARMPAHVLHRGPWNRWVVRRALAGDLPRSVRRRTGKTSLQPFFRRGLDQRRQAYRRLLDAGSGGWSRYVRAESLRPLLEGRFDDTASDPAPEILTLVWLAASFESWRPANGAPSHHHRDRRPAVAGGDIPSASTARIHRNHRELIL